MQRARILRLTGLAGTAVLALVVPLAAATAGPADTVLPPGDPDARDTPHAPRAPRAADAGAIADPLRGLTLPLPLLSDADRKAGSSGGDGDDRAAGGTGRTGRLVHCGAELTAQQGITAQTCQLTEDGRTWARTYYRNSTGDP